MNTRTIIFTGFYFFIVNCANESVLQKFTSGYYVVTSQTNAPANIIQNRVNVNNLSVAFRRIELMNIQNPSSPVTVFSRLNTLDFKLLPEEKAGSLEIASSKEALNEIEVTHCKLYIQALSFNVPVINLNSSGVKQIEKFFIFYNNNFYDGLNLFTGNAVVVSDDRLYFIDQSLPSTSPLSRVPSNRLNVQTPTTGSDAFGSYIQIPVNQFKITNGTAAFVSIIFNTSHSFRWTDAGGSLPGEFVGSANDIFNWEFILNSILVEVKEI